MGKAIIIKGADFSVNGIAPTFQRLSWIGVTTKDNRDDGAEHGQYISSGINMTINTRLIIECTFDNVAHSVISPGCNYSTNTQLYFWAQGGYLYAYAPPNLNMRTISSPWDGNRHVLEICKGWVKVDGETFSWATTPSNTGQVSPIYLDCSSLPDNSSQSGQYANTSAYNLVEGVKEPLAGVFKIHNVKIYSDYTDETSLVMDAIPVKRYSDNVVCFFNAVTGEYHERNNGSTPEYGV